MSTQEQIDQLNPATHLTASDLVEIGAYSTKKKSNNGIPVPMKDPVTGNPIGFSLLLMGQDSQLHKQTVAGFRRKHSLELQKNSKYVKSPEEIEEESLDLLVAMTTGWTPFAIDGREWVYSKSACREFYQEYDEFRDQADKAIYERQRFLAGSVTSSTPTPSTNSALA